MPKLEFTNLTSNPLCKITLQNQILDNNIMPCQNWPLNPGAISSLKSSPAYTMLLIWGPNLNFEPGLDWGKPEEAAPGGHGQNLQALLNKSCFSFSLTPHISSLKRKCNQGSRFFPKRHSNRPGAKSEQLLTGFSASGNFFAVFKKERKRN